jgi:hypothetical protein
MHVGEILGGAVVAEVIFSWPAWAVMPYQQFTTAIPRDAVFHPYDDCDLCFVQPFDRYSVMHFWIPESD